MTGLELAIQLNRERPDTKTLLISELDSGILTLGNDWQFMPKLYMADLLQDKIRDLLSDRAEAGRIAAGRPNAAKTILFAEGRGSRQTAARSLQTGDRHLIVACSGAEALEKAGDFAGTIHLLVANLDIVDMTGIELAHRLNKARPDTKILEAMKTAAADQRSGSVSSSRSSQFLNCGMTLKAFGTLPLR